MTSSTSTSTGELADPTVCSIEPLSTSSPLARASGYDRIVTGRRHGFTVPRGQRWRVKGLVKTDANVIVRGTLVMRAGDTLRFVDVDESRFVGGGMVPVKSDVGLWVMGRGRLDLVGTRKVGWNRTGDHGTWRDGEEIRVTPTEQGDHTTFGRFQRGTTVPRVGDLPPGEVFNLSRTVRVEGTWGGRSHIFIRSTQPQTLRYVTFRHLGPNRRGRFVLGRWPIHFHHCHDGSRDSLVEGCVVRDAGSHAFVTHMSDGVTFRDCVAFSVRGEPFWWDTADESNDTVYDHCLAAKVLPENRKRNPEGFHLLSGFFMGKGYGNVVRDSAVVGVQGGANSSGFHWPEVANGFPAAWSAEDLVSHNNVNYGVFLWQNQHLLQHEIARMTAYRNGKVGVLHGAYENRFHIVDARLVDNAVGVVQPAVAQTASAILHVNERIEGGDVAVSIQPHVFASAAPVRYEGCLFTGQADIAVVIADGGRNPSLIDLVRCKVEGRDLEAADVRIESMHPAGQVRIQRLDSTAISIDHTGAVIEIPPFD
jgi:hypothetical protein